MHIAMQLSNDISSVRYAQPRPIEQVHRLVTSLFASGEAFRRWVALGAADQGLVADLPDNPGSTAAALFGSIEVLRRRGHLDHEFFARLTVEYPRRRDDIARVAAAWAAATDLPGRRGASARRTLTYLGLTLAVLPLVGLLLLVTPKAPTPTPVSHEDHDDEAAKQAPSVATPTAALPASTNEAAPPTPRRSGRIARLVKKPSVVAATAALPAAPPPTIHRGEGCDLPATLTHELTVTANETLTSPAVPERFTVLLRHGARAPQVSPRPSPGQAERQRLYDRLKALGPEDLDGCRDIPLDVTFSQQQTTLTPRLP